MLSVCVCVSLRPWTQTYLANYNMDDTTLSSAALSPTNQNILLHNQSGHHWQGTNTSIINYCIMYFLCNFSRLPEYSFNPCSGIIRNHRLHLIVMSLVSLELEYVPNLFCWISIWNRVSQCSPNQPGHILQHQLPTCFIVPASGDKLWNQKDKFEIPTPLTRHTPLSLYVHLTLFCTKPITYLNFHWSNVKENMEETGAAHRKALWLRSPLPCRKAQAYWSVICLFHRTSPFRRHHDSRLACLRFRFVLFWY